MFNHLPFQLQLLTSSALLRSSSTTRFSTVFLSQPRRSYSSFPPSSSVFPSSSPVPNRTVISVGGRDATKFLNGITGVKIPETFVGRPFYGSFLHAQGRILFDVHIYPHPPTSSFLIDFDSRTSPSLIPAIKKFVLRSKVSLKDVSEHWDVWAAWGHDEQALEDGVREWKWGTGESAGLVGWTKEQTPLPGTSGSEVEGVAGLAEEVGGWDLRAKGMGWRGLVKKGGRPSLAASSPSSSPSSYTLHRILHGVPEGIEDIVPMSALPSESNLDFMGGVDFRKGCYVGQELTVRTYHTGATRKRIVPVRLVAAEEDASSTSPSSLNLPTPSSDVRLLALASSPTSPAPSSRGRSSGKMLSSVRTPEGSVVGLALLRLEQVGSVKRGEGEMSVEGGSDEGEGGEMGEGVGGKWKVVPREVGWWPKREVVVGSE